MKATAPKFGFCGPFLVVVRKGCALIKESKYIYFDLERKVLRYMLISGIFSAFCKSY